jgi:hypothetical protein
VPERTCIAESGKITVDQRRLLGAQCLGVKTITLDHTGPHILQNDIGPLDDQLTQGGSLRRIFEIDGHRTFVAVDGEESRRHSIDERRSPSARIIAAARFFNLDDVDAQFGQLLRADRSGNARPKFDHHDSG